MKKLIKIIICIMTCALLSTFAVACSGNGLGGNTPSGEDKIDTDDKSKVLVVYFSATNNTETVAGYIADATDGVLFELIPVNPYTSADLNYNISTSRVSREHDDESLRDVDLVTTAVEDWESYDVVFIGYPIWWGIAAWPVNNFVKNNDFTGKTVVPFATSASSGLGQSGMLLAEMAGTGNWLTGQRFSSNAPRNTVNSWGTSIFE